MADEAPTTRNGLVVWADVDRQRRGRVHEKFYQNLWFTLARSPWTSLALVPADEEGSAAGVATALAGVGRRLGHRSVTFLVMAGAIDYASAGKFMSAVAGKGDQASDGPSSSRVIVAVPSVIAEPLALAVTHAADLVALHVRLGNSHVKAAARTIELVGRDRFVGCVVS